MFISKKKVKELEKRIADLEAQVQNKSTNITMNYSGNIDEISAKLSETINETSKSISAEHDKRMKMKGSTSSNCLMD
jgi:BMFP domain-containing protein YqiC